MQMASFSRGRLVEGESQFWQPKGSWTAAVDVGGVVQVLDGHWPPGTLAPGANYFRFLDSICLDHPDRSAALRAGIRGVASGHIYTFTLEFPCRVAGREMRLTLTAAPCREGAYLTHTESFLTGADDPRNQPD
jgi:hypothetical protein